MRKRVPGGGCPQTAPPEWAAQGPQVHGGRSRQRAAIQNWTKDVDGAGRNTKATLCRQRLEAQRHSRSHGRAGLARGLCLGHTRTPPRDHPFWQRPLMIVTPGHVPVPAQSRQEARWQRGPQHLLQEACLSFLSGSPQPPACCLSLHLSFFTNPLFCLPPLRRTRFSLLPSAGCLGVDVR